MRCKDNHMRDNDNEWSSEFTLPLLNLLRATGNETAAYLKAVEICSSNWLLTECLKKCNRSQEVQILLIGIRSWQTACDNLDDIRTQLGCWKRYGDDLNNVCRIQTFKLRQSMQEFAMNQSKENIENICSDFDKFSTCFTREHGRLYMKSSHSIRSLSSVAASQCPVHQTSASTSEAKLKIRPFSEIPGPKEIPIFGSSHNIFKNDKKIQNYLNYLVELHDKYGNIVKESLGAGKGYVVHVYDPEDSRTVFQSDGKNPHIVPLQETTQQYRKMRGQNPGLGNLNGDEWYRLRSAVQQIMMRPQAVYAYLPFTNQVTQSLINHIKNETQRDGQVDMRRVAGRWSLESAGNTVFEKRLGALGDNIKWADKLVDVNKEIFQLSARMKFGFPFYRYFKTPQWKRMIELEDTFYAEADKLMDEAIEKLRSKENPENLLFASCLINKPELNKRDIKVIMLSLFADGLSTTAPMFVYNLFNIAIHKDIQERLRNEINEAVGKDEAIDVVHLQKMPLLRACVKETFRFFPIGTEVSRIPTKDVVLSGYLVPAGTPIDINTNVLMTYGPIKIL
ncbi:hypothetical protein WR25_11054 [Diploscapter pachys]|uniref:Cytochrome P450 n=1 Tax=Diploscapter pachys TaxID=2018661 RepID=A0A2A2LTH8_9BILA|nr:hypothetical protein WR25_11054 [Diploscapter pachys]